MIMALWSKKNDPTKNKVRLLSPYTQGEGRVSFPTEIPSDADVPAWWRELSPMTPRGRVILALSHWETTGPLAVELRNTILYLKTYCRDVEVMRVGSTYYLLYSIRNRLDNMRYFAGGNPRTIQSSESVSRLWPRVPASIRSFYGLHDGFFDYQAGSGFNPCVWMIYFDDEDWGVIDEFDLDVQIDLSSTLGFVGNNAGLLLGVDVSDCEAGKAVLWSAKEPPLYDQNFWHVADEWLVIFFDEE
jgi:hypothetical protein